MIPNQMKVTQVVELESALAGAEKKLEAEKAEGADSLRGLSPPCLPLFSPCLLLSPPWRVLSPTCLPPVSTRQGRACEGGGEARRRPRCQGLLSQPS